MRLIKSKGVLIQWNNLEIYFTFSFLCLHPNGWLRNLVNDTKTVELKETETRNNGKIACINNPMGIMYSLKKLLIQYWESQFDGDRLPFLYYTHPAGTEDDGCSIGAGDFITYNTLLLLAITPFPSVMIRLYITFGCMISVIIGLLVTNALGQLVKQNILPGVPLPVVIYSAYILFLDIFSTHPSDCSEFSSERIHIAEEKYLN